MRVLVAAASRHGSTAQIAQAIGEVLGSRGLSVAVLAPQDVTSPGDFDAIVLGSAVYSGHWLPAAIRLADRIGTDVPGRPIWLFSSGPVGDPSGRFARQMSADPVDLPALRSATGAREHRMFAGKLDRRDLQGLQRAALLLFRSLQGDFRDWSAIKGWAESIAGQLSAATAA